MKAFVISYYNGFVKYGIIDISKIYEITPEALDVLLLRMAGYLFASRTQTESLSFNVQHVFIIG